MTLHTGVHQKGNFTLTELIESIKDNDKLKKTGAIALFIGVVRGESSEGEKVEKITLEAYEEKANETLKQICDDLKNKPGIVDVQIHHLLGDFRVGEDMVYVAVAGSHRTDVFPVLQEAVERYKHEAAVFKKERVIDVNGSVKETWISEKDPDKNK
ncbi:MAG: molybdenum cofactor biosynthesis protein MoaE [Candidatus Bathyarchaeota archaeon]|nr:molybdenum cofactor biosynthesis protein MoaE [Candidatus Bathyarchaeota archaeon]